MLADAFAAFLAESIGGLIFVGLVLAGAALLPMLAALLRRRLPEARRVPRRLPSLAFGDSPRSQRSPRQAVRAHRVLWTVGLFSVLALGAQARVAATEGLTLRGVLVAIAFVLPTLLVAFHGQKRLARGATSMRKRNP